MIVFKEPSSYSIDELVYRLQRLKEAGNLEIIGINKSRDSGAGESLEYYLGLPRNQSKNADWGEYELKTFSSKGSDVTLFTLKWIFSDNKYDLRKLAIDFGKKHFSKHLQKDSIRLDRAIPYSSDNINELHYYYDKKQNNILLKYRSDQIAYIPGDELESHFNEKMRKMVLVKIVKDKIEQNHYFAIENSTLCNKTDFQKLLEQINANTIKLEFQIFIVNPFTPEELIKTKRSTICLPISKITSLYSEVMEI